MTSIAPLSCPLCHTLAPAVTGDTLLAGGSWQCPSCTQTWNARRLETVAAYAQFCAQRGETPIS
jgi:transposase-like protein